MRVLVVWELGGGYGHVAQLPAIAERLRKRGHEPLFALRDLSLVEASLGRSGYRLLQAPVWLPVATGIPPAANYAELLFRFGYLETDRLTALVRAWRELYRLADPDVLLLNHAPTALLGARGLALRSIRFGTGFECPPALSLLPGFHSSVGDDRLVNSERRVCESVNTVLSAVGAPQLDSFSDLVCADETVLCTFRELDPYAAARVNGHYAGALMTPATGIEPQWPDGEGCRIFGYLKANYPGFREVLRQLAESPHRVLVHTPNLAPQDRQRFATDRLRFTAPVNVQRASKAADVVLSHAGHGTVTAALLAGCRQLMLPIHLEQGLNAHGIVRLGAGVLVDKDSKSRIGELLEELLGDGGFAAEAAVFAENHGSLNPIATLLDSVEG